MTSLWRQLTRGTSALLNRRKTDRDIADEVDHYLDQSTEIHVARGVPAAEARRRARLELGGETNVAEQVRSYGWENVVEAFFVDVRHAARRLAGAPGFAAIAIITLAVGIGGTTAIFSAVNPILFRTLPYPDAERIRVILETTVNGTPSAATFGMYHGFAEASRSFAAIAVLRPWQPTMTGGEQPERFQGMRVSASYFNVLGVAPVIGVGFSEADDRAGGANVAIISDALWRRRFGADPGVIGRQVRLDDAGYSVIGVMPAGFDDILAPGTELWTTLQYDMSQGRAWGHHLRMVGRLQATVRADDAAAELNAIGMRVLREQRPPTYSDDVVWTVPSLQADVTRAVRPALLAILGAVVLVLLIACLNVTNLLIARGVSRRDEFAVRAALGAGRPRLIRQLFTESLFLALIGGVLGVAVAYAGVRVLVALSPPELPRASAIAVDPAALVFGFAITTLIGLAAGLIPARQAADHVQRDLQHGSRRTVGGAHRRVRSALVVMEVALALVLLAGSGLLLRSLQRLLAVSPGFDAAGAMTLQVHASGFRLAEDSTTHRFFAEALDAVLRVPGVSAAALTSQLPLSDDFDTYGVHLDSPFAGRPDEDRSAFRYAVTPGYLELMGIPLISGRTFSDEDRAGAPLVAVINESLAARRFPGIDPIGQRLRIGPTDGPLYTVVGVVGDVKQVSLAVVAADAVYTTASQWRFADTVMSLVIRGRGDLAALAPAIRQAVWSVDADQPVVRLAMMHDLLAASAAQRRFALVLFQAFALAALVLAAAGIYGMLSGTVAERTREIGLRSAVGASRTDILSLVLGQGLRLVVLGVLIGLAGAAAGSRAIDAMLFGVSPLDPVTFLAVIMLLVTVALLACALPAWRAAQLDPATTLRND